MVHAPDFLTFPASRNAGAREERARSVNTTLEARVMPAKYATNLNFFIVTSHLGSNML
jgi:hypothetical protein